MKVFVKQSTANKDVVGSWGPIRNVDEAFCSGANGCATVAKLPQSTVRAVDETRH